jgi:dihydrofolate synthase/folylpolyglutamate synthase
VTIRNLAEASKALSPYVPLVTNFSDRDQTLERMTPLMELIGNPQDNLRIIHVAGTSGKTSTSYYMASLLRAGGQKVGLTVSPHIDSINERVQVDGVPLPEATFCHELGIFLDIVKKAKQPPSYFEVMFAFALWVFVRHDVDYAVVETGLGGLYDASNVSERADKVCLITDIGHDHMEVLGKTLEKIAEQKIGIVHNQNQAFMYRQAPEIMRVVRQWTRKHQAPLHVLNEASQRKRYQEILVNTVSYQQRNWMLAYRAYRYLRARDGLKRLTKPALKETQTAYIPGRMDIRELNGSGKTVVMDGAHNLQKMTTFLDSFKKLYPGKKPAVLLSMKDSKEYQDIVPLLVPFASRIITTSFDTSQDAKIRSMDPAKLAKALKEGGAKNIEAIPEHSEAVPALLDSPGKLFVITGSFYLLARIRNNEHLV